MWARQLSTWVALLVGLLTGGVAGYLLCAWRSFDPGPIGKWGSFPVRPHTEWLAEGQKMKLTRDFIYIDPREKIWTANAESVVDGASIPRVLWTIVGSPFTGQYRDASIVHDVACVERTASQHDVHRMFYEACRCAGVSEREASILYGGVFHFGPRWVHESRQATRTLPDGTVVPYQYTVTVMRPNPNPNPKADEEAIRQLAEYIDERKPTIEEIENLDPATL